MTPPLTPTVGWNVLHLFCQVTPLADGAALASAVKAIEADDHQVVPVALVGHRGDVCLLALGPDLWRLRRFQTEVVEAGFDVVDSYVSLTEVSEYAEGMPEARKQARLYPQLPPEGKTAFCFYPMSKRRGDKHNWYELPYDERESLMMGHGATGRTFAGRVLQLVTGSTGLDDYEWGVTLFGVHPDDLKACVYQMRYDEASARFAEFGPFVTGAVGTVDEVLAAVGVRS
ncbi:MAG TPA: chlorite dismutase family protein [Acidimicrobiales bacterium]|nr:chlorite dismutase family protein [Acidimicrobiales bacterium]